MVEPGGSNPVVDDEEFEILQDHPARDGDRCDGDRWDDSIRDPSGLSHR